MNAFMLKEKDLRISVYSKRERFPNAYLTVRNMSDLDTGVYTCRAENGIGIERERKYHEQTIPVYVRDNIIEPNEDEPGRGKILVPGEPLILQCKTEECPYCSIVWFKKGEKLTSIEDIMQVDEENNTLTIHSATLNDTGLYDCAVNRALLNVDLRASILVQTCEELLSKGLEIESICEMPPVADLSMSKAQLYRSSVITMLISLLVASLWRKIMFSL